jgi:rare lipoprotein A
MSLPGRFIAAMPSMRSVCFTGIFVACGMAAWADEPASSPSERYPKADHQAGADVGLVAGAQSVPPVREHSLAPVHEQVIAHPPLDRSGHKRRGKASFYAREFSGRKMADGTVMRPQSDNAASKTLPLGTTAKVTNLETGQSAVVTIRDRGPYIRGRIVDLSPSTAKDIGIDHKNGVAGVEVAPIAVPLPDGGVKLGAAADAEAMSRNNNN